MPDYAAVEVLSPRSGRWELMSSGGRVVVFDTPRTAEQVLPMLGGGRVAVWDGDGKGVSFREISLEAPNRARIVWPYSPGEVAPWKRHVIWSEWMGGGE